MKRKYYLANILQEIHKDDQKNELHIFVLNNSISEFYNKIEYTKNLQNKLQDSLDNLKIEKKNLEAREKELEHKHETFLKLKNDIEAQKEELKGAHTYKDELLVQTNNSEKKFTELYIKARDEQQAISAEISQLEKKLRSELGKGAKKKLDFSALSWPVPENTITAYFHDPTYPFRYLFEHPGIDIRAPQGTAIKAPAEGYVLSARDGGRGYSYIALIHGNAISTVYGHVSQILAMEGEFVSAGETIALSGGMPGTPGAGRLSTGPHLHFEVRLNGIPVNPLDYLP